MHETLYKYICFYFLFDLGAIFKIVNILDSTIYFTDVLPKIFEGWYDVGQRNYRIWIGYYLNILITEPKDVEVIMTVCYFNISPYLCSFRNL